MAKTPLEKYIDQERIANFINDAKSNPSLTAQFEHPLIRPIQDEHLRKVYLLLSFFAANAFMQSGAEETALMSKVFSIAAAISPNSLDSGEIKELMEQSILRSDKNKLNEYVQDLRQHDLTMPLLFHLFSISNEEMTGEIEKILYKFAEKFDMSATMRDVLNGATPKERVEIFNEKLNEQQCAQNDERRATVREKGRQLEESLRDSTPQKRFTELYFFYKDNNLQEDMLNYADALYSLAIQEGNLSVAKDWLLRAIELNNSPERRMQLLELYKKRCPSGSNPIEFAYQKMISDGIDGAQEDYSAYKKQIAAQQQKTHSTTSSNNSVGCGTVTFVLLVIAGVAWFFWPSSGGKQEKPTPPPAVEQQQQKKEETKPSPAVPKEEPRVQAMKAFREYHENITKRDFQQAYAYFDREMQEYMNYDKWVSGHQATVKSNPYDIKVASESPEKVVLTYSLQTVDNPGGEKVFEGKAVVVKTENGWKINDIENTLKQADSPKPQQQPVPSAPPTTTPQPAPSAPSALPAKPEIAYRTFTENWYGFSFEYPASEGDFPQADSKGGERAVEYWIDLPNNQGRVLMGTEFAWHDATEADMRYVADDKHSNDFEMLSVNSYIVRWNQGNEKITRKTFMVPNHRKGSSGFVRQYIEIRQRGKLSPQNQEVAQHMMESFQPGE